MSNKNLNLKQTVIDNDYSVRSGAYAVINPNLEMKLDQFGQYEAVPVSDEVKIDWQDPKLNQVCSMSDASPNEDQVAKDLFAGDANVKHDPILGYYQDCYVGYVTENGFRDRASSGGVTSWILKELLESGQIDGVVHVKAADDSDGILFKYGVSTSVDELNQSAKSRYYPVEFSRAINKIKSMPGKFAIVGIPSFIFEIRLLALQDPVVAEKIKYTLGLICGHQKTTKYAENIAWQNGVKPKEIKQIDFRKKNPNQDATLYSTEIIARSDSGEDEIITKTHTDFFGTNWGQGFFKVKFSDFTDDAFNETADVVMGDAWLPEYAKDSLGNNVVIVRNAEIAKLIKQGLKDNKLHLDAVDTDTVKRSQSGLIHHYRDELPYRLHKQDQAGIWRPTKRVEASNKIPRLKRQAQDIRSEIAEQSKTIYREAEKRDDWNYFKTNMEPLVNKYHSVYKLINLQKKIIRIKNNGPVWFFKKVKQKLLG